MVAALARPSEGVTVDHASALEPSDLSRVATVDVCTETSGAKRRSTTMTLTSSPTPCLRDASVTAQI